MPGLTFAIEEAKKLVFALRAIIPLTATYSVHAEERRYSVHGAMEKNQATQQHWECRQVEEKAPFVRREQASALLLHLPAIPVAVQHALR